MSRLHIARAPLWRAGAWWFVAGVVALVSASCGGEEVAEQKEDTTLLETGIATPVKGEAKAGSAAAAKAPAPGASRAAGKPAAPQFARYLALFRADEEEARLGFFDQTTDDDRMNYLRRHGKVREFELRQLLRSGMTLEEVENLLGPPNSMVDHPHKAVRSPRWKYREFNGGDYMYYTLNFQDGQLVDWYLTIPTVEQAVSYRPEDDPLVKIFLERSFVFAGTFEKEGSRLPEDANDARKRKLTEWITRAGGEVVPQISETTDFVVLGRNHQDDANYKAGEARFADTLNEAQLRYYLRANGINVDE
ncbi:MAG: hypothetical protein HY719_05850 [Planctomycetes bacterium]|nr:hypothetical protein [Planctomycetota bacterium]